MELSAYKQERRSQRKSSERYSLSFKSTKNTTSSSRRRRTQPQELLSPETTSREELTKLPRLLLTCPMSTQDKESWLLDASEDSTQLSQPLLEVPPPPRKPKRRNERLCLVFRHFLFDSIF